MIIVKSSLNECPFTYTVIMAMETDRLMDRYRTLYCTVPYIAACVEASRMVFWDRSVHR